MEKRISQLRPFSHFLRSVILLLAFTFPFTSSAEKKGGMFLGAGAGVLGGESSSLFGYGGMIGVRSESVGGAFRYIIAKDGSTKNTVMAGDVVLWLGQVFYIGPTIGQAKVSGGGVSFSWMVYGASTGFAIPLGDSLSFGVDGAYVTGKFVGQTVNLWSAIGNFKIFF